MGAERAFYSFYEEEGIGVGERERGDGRGVGRWDG
jgi:hypothetical protein